MRTQEWAAVLLALAGGPLSATEAPADLTQLSWDEMEALDGGDLSLSVNRDTQIMTVTRIEPQSGTVAEAYNVKVTTSVVRNKEVALGVPKGAMENPERTVASGPDQVRLKQFPTGTAGLQADLSTQNGVAGPVIRTNASQQVTVVSGSTVTGTKADSGYNIHYVDPAKATNTWGCVGVQSEAAMNRLAATLKADTAATKSPADLRQTISVSAYSKGNPAPASAFRPTEAKPVSLWGPSITSTVSARPWFKLW